MTVRDPYTGVERPAVPRPPRSSFRRWSPALLIAAIAIAGGVAEWRNSEHAPPPPQAVIAARPSATSAPAIAVPVAPVATTPAATADDLARATVALTRAGDQLSNDATLLIALAVLQALVLAGQLFLYGQQKRAGRGNRPASAA
jgi:hypothetical protein